MWGAVVAVVVPAGCGFLFVYDWSAAFRLAADFCV